MLFYQVKAACSLVDNGRMKNAYEQSQNCWFRLIEDINDTLETDANESKIFMTIYKASPEELFFIAVIDSLDPPTPKTLLKFFADCVSEKYGLSLQRKAQMKEISPKEARKSFENNSRFISRQRYWDNDNYSLDYYDNRNFQITEQLFDKYLKKILDEGRIPYTSEQIKNVLGDKTSFRPSNIYQMYDRLYRNNLRNNAYTAYKEVSRVTLAVRKHSAKDAYSRLQSMIGLHEVKKVIENILDTFRAQKIRSAIGLNQFRPNMHMVFTGNPGSAKTTVASVEPHPYI